MTKNDPNLANLREVALALGTLTDRVVFLGGAVTGLLLTDPAAAGIRTTMDVDGVVSANLVEYHAMGDQLRSRGFVQDVESGITCRYKHRDTGLLLDLMPIDEKVLGFSNPWYQDALDTATPISLGEGLAIKLIQAPVFIATKLAAWEGRGNGDLLGSHDVEDILTVIDGRPELPQEVKGCRGELRAAIQHGLRALERHRDWSDMAGMLADPERAQTVQERIDEIHRA